MSFKWSRFSDPLQKVFQSQAYNRLNVGMQDTIAKGLTNAITGAGYGAAMGGVYGMFSRNETVLGGAAKGAMIGAGVHGGYAGGMEAYKNRKTLLL